MYHSIYTACRCDILENPGFVTYTDSYGYAQMLSWQMPCVSPGVPSGCNPSISYPVPPDVLGYKQYFGRATVFDAHNLTFNNPDHSGACIVNPATCECYPATEGELQCSSCRVSLLGVLDMYSQT